MDTYHVDFEMDWATASNCGVQDPVMPPIGGDLDAWIQIEFPRQDAAFKAHEAAMRSAWEDHLQYAMRLLGDKLMRSTVYESRKPKVRLRLSIEENI